jgi:PAS domain S-box-containing protein
MKQKAYDQNSPRNLGQAINDNLELNISYALESHFDFVVILDPNGCILGASQTVADLHQLPIEELIGKCAWDILPPEVVPQRKRYVEQVFRTGTSVRFQDERLGAWHDQIILPVLNKEGIAEMVVVLHYDITDHKKAVKALKKSEESFRNLVETSHDLIWRCDKKGHFTYLSPAWEKILGYKPDEMLGHHFGEFKPSGITKKDNNLVKQVMKGVELFGRETTYTSKSGEEVNLVFNVVRLHDGEGNVLGSQGSAFDITERKKTEKKLKVNESRYRNLFMNSPVAILESNLAGIGEWLQKLRDQGVDDLAIYLRDHPGSLRLAADLIEILDLNLLAAKIFDLNENLTNIIPNIFSKNSYVMLSNLLIAIWEGRSIFEEEGSGFTCKGNNIDFILQWHTTSGEDGSLILSKSMFAITDITEKKVLKQRATQSEKMATLGLLVSGIAHEINNPNNFIMFNIPILRDYLEILLPIIDDYYGAQSDHKIFGMCYSEFRKDVIDLLDNMEHGTNRINNTISRLREFFTPHVREHFHLVDLQSVIDKSINLCRSQLTRMVKTVEIDLPQELSEFYSEPNILEHIITNLLINAAYAADKKDSKIKLTVVQGKSPQDHLIIEVWDNGCGIAESDIEHIFTPFFTTRSSESGSGLGMFICDNLVKKLGGRIEVKSRLGAESKFRVILPKIIPAK